MRFLKYLSKMRIYCDMDGVLTDFDKRVLNDVHPDWQKIAKKDKQKAYDMIDEFGAFDFWVNMPWMPDGKKLWKFLENLNNINPETANNKIHILSAISKIDSGGKEGKLAWIKKNLGHEYIPYTNIVRRHQKQDYSSPYYILIDDTKQNILEWTNAGGIGILHKNANDTIKKLREFYNGFKK